MRQPGGAYRGSSAIRCIRGRRRLQRHYTRAGLEVIHDHLSPTFMGAPVFIYQTVRRVELPAERIGVGTRRSPQVSRIKEGA
jgi:hypothetical protein